MTQISFTPVKQTYQKLFPNETEIPSPNELVTRSMECLHAKSLGRCVVPYNECGGEETLLMKPLQRDRPNSCQNNARYVVQVLSE